ncbi:MAG: hypothetical protein ACRCUL_00765, partial [Plesiomonas sp.]
RRTPVYALSFAEFERYSSEVTVVIEKTSIKAGNEAFVYRPFSVNAVFCSLSFIMFYASHSPSVFQFSAFCFASLEKR